MTRANCHLISDPDITHSWHEGRSTFDDAQEEARTSIGSNPFDDYAHQSFHEHAAADHGCGTHAASQAGSSGQG